MPKVGSEKSKRAVELLKSGWRITNVADKLHVSYQTVNVWRLKYIVEPAVASMQQERDSAIKHAMELSEEIIKLKMAIKSIDESTQLREENTRLKAKLLRYEDS